MSVWAHVRAVGVVAGAGLDPSVVPVEARIRFVLREDAPGVGIHVPPDAWDVLRARMEDMYEAWVRDYGFGAGEPIGSDAERRVGSFGGVA